MPIDFAKNVLILHSKHWAAAAAAAATANFRALLPVPLVEKISFHLVLIKRKFPTSCFCRPSPTMRTRMAAACCRRHALLPRRMVVKKWQNRGVLGCGKSVSLSPYLFESLMARSEFYPERWKRIH